MTHNPLTIGAVLEDKEKRYASLREKIAAEKAERLDRYAKFEQAYTKAQSAGGAAGNAATPTPMVVGQPTTLFGGEIDRTKPMYHVPEGACGFAWVKVMDGNSSFARWLVKNKLARKAYGRGVEIWISAHGQSIERKQAHARAMAEVLRAELGVKCYADSRSGLSAMTKQQVYELLKRAGHSAAKALEIAIDFERGDEIAKQWVAAQTKHVWIDDYGAAYLVAPDGSLTRAYWLALTWAK